MYDYSLSMIEYIGFIRYSKTLQPFCPMILRNTVRKGILQLCDFEISETMKLLASVQSKIDITTYMWTAHNKKHCFIAITAHWIDSSWKLQNRI